MPDPNSWSGPGALFVACATAGLLHPFPEDVPLLYAGMAIADGAAPLPILAVAIAGVLIRDLLLFMVGRTAGAWLLHRPLVGRILGVRRIERARHVVAEHDAMAVLFNRFLVGVRSPIFLVAGAAGVTPARFVAYDLLGLWITVPLALFLGDRFGPGFVEGATWALSQTRVAGLVLPIGAAAFVV